MILCIFIAVGIILAGYLNVKAHRKEVQAEEVRLGRPLTHREEEALWDRRSTTFLG